MSFSSLDMIEAFLLGLFIGGFFGFISLAMCAIQREEKFKEEGSFD